MILFESKLAFMTLKLSYYFMEKSLCKLSKDSILNATPTFYLKLKVLIKNVLKREDIRITTR